MCQKLSNTRRYLIPPITIQPLNFVRIKYHGEKAKLTFFLIFLKEIILFAVVQKDQIKQRNVPKLVTDEVVLVLKIIEYKNANINFFSLNLPKIFLKTVVFN